MYEVFISFKDKDDRNGKRTKDSKIAEQIYLELTRREIKTFFSKEEIKKNAESDWKNAIRKALDEARVFILVGTSLENINSSQVQYEWEDFLTLIRDGMKPDGVLVPYLDCNKINIKDKCFDRDLRKRQILKIPSDTVLDVCNFVGKNISIDDTLSQPTSDDCNEKKILPKILDKVKVIISRKYTKWVCGIILAIVIFTVFVMPLGKHSKSLTETAYNTDSQSPAETADNTATENEPPELTDITIKNKEITLYPGREWERLWVIFDPSDANIDGANYFSDNVRLVTVDRKSEVVKLSLSQWREETEQSTKVHVQLGTIDKFVPVIVKDSAAENWVKNADNGIPDDNDSVNTEKMSEF